MKGRCLHAWRVLINLETAVWCKFLRFAACMLLTVAYEEYIYIEVLCSSYVILPKIVRARFRDFL